jgi:hypothetical protein
MIAPADKSKGVDVKDVAVAFVELAMDPISIILVKFYRFLFYPNTPLITIRSWQTQHESYHDQIQSRNPASAVPQSPK